MEFNDLILKRYSCKNFSGRQVEKAALEAILEAGRVAPTARNKQVQRIYVVQSEEGIGKIDALTPCRYGAPTVLIVAYDPEDAFAYPGGVYDSGAEDATIVATHMILAAANAGVDSCWLNKFDPDETVKLFGLPAEQVPVMLMDLGYAADGAGPLPKHTDRKPIEETVKYI